MAERQHPDERDVDAIFESIVARWDDPPAEDPTIDVPAAGSDAPRYHRPCEPRRPSRRNDGDAAPGAPDEVSDERPREPEPVPWRTDPTNTVADALLGTDDDPGSADDEEGFTPPPPAPLPPASH